jgi:predicted Zn-dependent protease
MIAARAGYDPRAAITFWEKMGRANQRSVPEFLSTHPSSSTRVSELQEAMPEALNIYRNTSR